jgi:hypothetical protein
MSLLQFTLMFTSFGNYQLELQPMILSKGNREVSEELPLHNSRLFFNATRQLSQPRFLVLCDTSQPPY